MKILKKSEILAESNRQRQEQVDEGVALAQKIDELRVTLSTLESQHTAYIASMKGQLEKEISPLTKQREELKAAIEQARTELAALRIPLDKEWDMARAEKAKLDVRARNLELKEQELVEIEKVIEKQQADVDYDKAVATSLKKEALDEVNSAADLKKEAEDLLLSAKADAEKRKNVSETLEHELTDWELELEFREVDVENKEEEVAQRQKHLNDRERFINDKYATLERTINRLNK